MTIRIHCQLLNGKMIFILSQQLWEDWIEKESTGNWQLKDSGVFRHEEINHKQLELLFKRQKERRKGSELNMK